MTVCEHGVVSQDGSEYCLPCQALREWDTLQERERDKARDVGQDPADALAGRDCVGDLQEDHPRLLDFLRTRIGSR